MRVSLIYARSENYCIGDRGELPWSLPDEYAHFLRTTAGAAVIMGRKTYEDHNSYLSGRVNIVVTRNPLMTLATHVLRASGLTRRSGLAERDSDSAFVIGGSSLLAEALPLATTVFETVVHAQLRGDTFVEPFDFSNWHSQQVAVHPADMAHAYGYTVYRHTRRLAGEA